MSKFLSAFFKSSLFIDSGVFKDKGYVSYFVDLVLFGVLCL